MIPLLGNSELSSPTMMGVLSSKTADLLVNQGQTLANQIEKTSLTTEAQAKAPAITDLYSSAYQKIASGDMTGFADMQKARSLGIGNPILMKTLDDADMIAGHLANEWMTTQRFQKKEEFDKDREQFQLDKQEQMQQHVDARHSDMEMQRYSHDDMVQATALYKQELAGTQRDNYYGQKAYEKETEAWQQRQAAANRKGELLGTDPEQIPKPAPFQPRPEPKLDDYIKNIKAQAPAAGAAPLPSQLEPTAVDLPSSDGGSTRDLSPVTPSDMKSVPATPLSKGKYVPDWKENARGVPLPSQSADPIVGMSPDDLMGGQSVPSTPKPKPNSTPPVVQPPADETKTASTRHPAGMPVRSSEPEEPMTEPFSQSVAKKVQQGAPLQQIPFGYNEQSGIGMVVNIHPPTAKLKSFDAKVTEGKIDEHYEVSKEEQDAAGVVGHFADKQNFSQWMAYEQRMGNPISMDPKTEGKREYWVASTGRSVFKENSMNPGAPDKPHEFDKDDYQKWEEMKKLERAGVVTVQHTELPKAAKDKFRNTAIADFAQGKLSAEDMQSANSQLSKLGVDPVTDEDVKSYQSDLQSKAASAVDKKHAQSEREQALSQLSSEGFIIPSQAKAMEETKAQVDNSRQRYKDIPGEIENLQGIIDSVKRSSPGKLEGDDLEKAANAKIQINRLTKDMKAHEKILLRLDPTVGTDKSPIKGL